MEKMFYNKNIENFLKIIILIIIIFNCERNNNNSNNDTDNFVINLRDTKIPNNYYQWGVTKYDTLKLREEPEENSKVINHLRIGSVFEIIKKDKEIKNFNNIYDYWYYINYNGETGWIFSSFIDIFNTYEEAHRRSEELLYGEK